MRMLTSLPEHQKVDWLWWLLPSATKGIHAYARTFDDTGDGSRQEHVLLRHGARCRSSSSSGGSRASRGGRVKTRALPIGLPRRGAGDERQVKRRGQGSRVRELWAKACSCNSGVGEEFKHKQMDLSRFALLFIVYIIKAEYIMQRSIPNSYWLYTSGMRAGCVITEVLLARSRQRKNTACCEAGVP